jgi:hypothetical protein
MMSQNSYDLLGILDRAGVEYAWVRDGGRLKVKSGMTANDEVMYPSRTVVVPLAQPYGAFAKALLENQRYPDLRDGAGHPIPPYDVTAHTLPLLMGVEVQPVYAPYRPALVARPHIEVARGDCVLTSRKRVALYKSHVPSMDEGWTRWVLERGCVEYEQITDEDIRRGNFEQKQRGPGLREARYDAIIIPDQSPRAILEGHRRGTMPEELTGGLGAEGVKALREFVERGGTLVCLNNASNFAIEQLKLPVRDVTDGLPRTEFYVPGSILRTVLDTTHPLAKEMPRESVAWVEDSPVFEIKSDPLALVRVKIVARYPQSGNPLLSGWLLGEEKLRGRAALVEAGLGEGRVYLFGFRPQYRAQSLATYPLLFNALGPQRPAAP